MEATLTMQTGDHLAEVVATAHRLLAHDQTDRLFELVDTVIPRWDRDTGLEEAKVTPEIAGLLLQAAQNRLAKVDHQQLEAATYLPVIEWPQNLCVPLAIARKIAKQDPERALWIRTKAAELVSEVDSNGLEHYLDQFCLAGSHLAGKDFCGYM